MRSLSLLFLFATVFDQFPRTSAVRMLESSSLNTCQADSSITAALFNVVYTPDNNTLTYDISANSSVTGTFTVQLQVIAYGYTAMNKSIDPCQSILSSNFCPIQQTGPLVLQSAITLPTDLSSKIPSMARLIHRTYLSSTRLTCCRHCVHGSRLGWNSSNQHHFEHREVCCLCRG
jgi:hypothetical protein